MKKKTGKKPFFASFLEKQIQDPETIQGGIASATTAPLVDASTAPVMDTVTRPGGDHVTLKYPSDGDEDTILL